MVAPQFPGLNCQELVDFREQCPWKNEMRTARVWWEANGSDVITSFRLTNERTDGYPASLAGGTRARTVIGTMQHRFGGTWAIRWDGFGEVGVDAGNGYVGSTSGYFEFPRNTAASIQVHIRSTNPANPVRNIWCGELRYYATRNNPLLKEEWRDHIVAAGIKHVRFMQWQHTGSSAVQVWQPVSGLVGVKPPFAAGGVEYFTDSGYVANDTDLANGATYSSILNATIELNLQGIYLAVPHQANESEAAQDAYLDFVHRLLLFIRDHRHPATFAAFLGAIWLAYSNETWNSAMAAYEYCKARGVALGLDGANDHEKGHSFYAYRSMQVFQTALAAKQTLNLQNPIKRVLEGQATAGEYPFRFRTQINARSVAPTNVAADYWSVASYCGHTEFEAGSPTPRVRLGSSNPWHTPAEFTALTDQDIEVECRRDLTQRVLAPVSVSSDPVTFPSNPTLRNGGIAADIVFAGARGMEVICYEGGSDHIVLPSHGSWSAAVARSIAWHQTANCERICFETLEAHTAAGCRGTFFFDEGTAWSGVSGCWSWYFDARDGYSDDAKLNAARRHILSLPGQLTAQIPIPEVIARARGFDAVIGLGNLAASMGSAVETASATGFSAAFSSVPLTASLGAATVVASAGGLETEGIAPPLLAEFGEARAVTSATGFPDAIIGSPVLLDATFGGSTTVCGATGFSAVLVADGLVAGLGRAVTFPCLGGFAATLLSHNLTAAMGEARVRVPTQRAMRAVIAGANGVAVGPLFRQFQKVDLIDGALVPHGTTFWVGQVMGWYDGRVRPLRAGDDFAGFSTNSERGLVVGPDGIEVIRTDDYQSKMNVIGSVWMVADRPAFVGDIVYARDDAVLTLSQTDSEIGVVQHVGRGGRRLLVHFEGVGVRVGT